MDPQQGPPSGLQNPFRPRFWPYVDIVSSMLFFQKRLAENKKHRRWGTKMVAEYLLSRGYVMGNKVPKCCQNRLSKLSCALWNNGIAAKSWKFERRLDPWSAISHHFFWANLHKVQVMARHMIAFCPTSRKMYHGNRSICSECTMKIRQAQTLNVIPSVMWVLFDMAVLVATRQKKYKLLAPPIRRKRQKKMVSHLGSSSKTGGSKP